MTHVLQEKKKCLRLANTDGREILMLHCTANMDNICSRNFDLSISKRFAYGRCIYFSKCPNVCLHYGQDLILCMGFFRERLSHMEQQ
jgi:hypothetical protein